MDILQAEQGSSGDGDTNISQPGPGSNSSCKGDILPDEILMMIFRQLSDGATLLDVLPLVCKRWCRAARDRSAWAGVDLTLGDDLERETRILLHAPAAKSLTIRSRSESSFDLDDDETLELKVKSSLRRSQVLINAFTLLETGHDLIPSKKLLREIARFLKRQRELQELRLFVFPEDPCPWWPVVLKLRHLKKLELRLNRAVDYEDELAGARLPELRELIIRFSGMRYETFGANCLPPENIISDLVRGTAALRVLDVELPPDDAFDDRQACMQLRGLEHVALNVYDDCDGRSRIRGQAAVPVVRKAFQFLLELDTSALRTATISLCRGEHANHSTAMRERCNALLREYAPKIPHVAVEMQLGGPDCADCADEEWIGGCRRHDWPNSDDSLDSFDDIIADY